jgi:hypothetical protein
MLGLRMQGQQIDQSSRLDVKRRSGTLQLPVKRSDTNAEH